MQTFHIILNILNMPKDSQNICDELKSTVVCRDKFFSTFPDAVWSGASVEWLSCVWHILMK
jgi:hypothetical protein